jgi:uncharacterized protein YggE
MKYGAMALLLGALLVQSGSAEDRLDKVVRVTGTAEVKVVPDRAVIEMGVEKDDVSASQAKRSADATARKLMAVLKQSGIDDKDVQTSYLSLQPQWRRVKGKSIQTFAATETLTITVKDLSRLDTLLEGLIKAGGNRIDSVRYETSDLRKYRDQAREMAVKAAREKAQALAKALGQEIGKASSIEEPNDITLPSGFFANESAEIGGVAKKSIAVGQKTISASVTVSFDLM